MASKPIEPIIFNFVFKINGRPTDCGIKKSTWEGEHYYAVCANINRETKEYPLQFDKATEKYSLPDNAPKELKMIESNLSDIICDMSREC